MSWSRPTTCRRASSVASTTSQRRSSSMWVFPIDPTLAQCAAERMTSWRRCNEAITSARLSSGMRSDLRSGARYATRLVIVPSRSAQDEETVGAIRARLGDMSKFSLVGQGGLENLVDSLSDARVRFDHLQHVQQDCPEITEIELGASLPSDLHEPLVHNRARFQEAAEAESCRQANASRAYHGAAAAADRGGPPSSANRSIAQSRRPARRHRGMTGRMIRDGVAGP